MTGVPPPSAVPPAAAVLRRALLIWGAGHLALGDRRGWLLAAMQLLAVGTLAAVAALYIESTRWLVVLLGLIGVVAVWIAQAVDAHRRAVAAGARPGGELQVAAILPLIVALVGGFWLVGGDLGSPGATLQRYVSAWQSDRPMSAVALLAEPVAPDLLATEWQGQREQLRVLVAGAAARYGSQAGLDPRLPYNSLRFAEAVGAGGDGRAVVAVDLVRRERFETQLFGLIPTASQRTVVIQRLGEVRLRVEQAPPPWWLPAGLAPPARVWVIDEVALELGD